MKLMNLLFPLRKVEIADHERGLLFHRDNFVRVLEPGTHRLWDPRGRMHVDRYDLSEPAFEHPILDFLVKTQAVLRERLLVVELGDHEVGLLTVDGKLEDLVLPATRKAYWKDVYDVQVRVQETLSDFEVPQELVSQLGHARGIDRQTLLAALLYAEVADNHVGLLFVNGKLERTLAPGAHAFWTFDRTLQVRYVDLRLQTLEVTGQEILSKDKVSLRLNLSATYRVADAEKAVTALSDFGDFLYKELQFGLREAVGTKTLDEVLASKDELGVAISAQVESRVAEYGLVIQSIGVKDIILPGEMKSLLNQVVEAEKQAQANLIRRREETAATRSLHNTAKMLERSPTLLRLKELEALEKVTERIDTLTVYGGLDGVLHQLVKLQDRD
ncbi:MAG: slipin family protein [Myxococcota bacterium]|nr:slipin family protein [Myxococcota bacterium]